MSASEAQIVGARYLIIGTFSPYMKGPAPVVNVIAGDAGEQGRLGPAATLPAHRSWPAARTWPRSRPSLGRAGTGPSGSRAWLASCATTPAAKDCGDCANGRLITVRCVSLNAGPRLPPPWRLSWAGAG